MTFICKSSHFSKTEKRKKKLRTKLGISDHTYIVVSGNSGIPHVIEKNIINRVKKHFLTIYPAGKCQF